MEFTSPARAYHEYLGPALFEPLAEEVLGVAAPGAGEAVLDVACGTGVLTRRLAAAVGSGGEVVGVDVNPMMVEVARSVPAPDGARIDYREGDGTALDLPSGTFDFVSCQQGLQFFPDRLRGVTEMRRVAADGARAVVACWCGLDRLPLFAALTEAEDENLRAFGVGATREDLTAPFSLGDADELHDLLERGGWVDVSVVERTVDARFSDPERFLERMEFAYAAVVPQFAEDPDVFRQYLAAIVRDTKEIVEAHRRGDHVVAPMYVNVATARAADGTAA
jgi:SAM-dependent methyltransferase